MPLMRFLGREPYTIIVQRQPKLHEYIVRTKVREEPPPDWSPIIGDVVHNWRSALDHLAWQLVIRNKRKPSGGTQFPIFSKSPFDASLYPNIKEAEDTLKRWNRQVKGMHSGDVALIERLQPYNVGENAGVPVLSMLAELSNWDKHREYQLTGQTLKGSTFYVKEWRDCKWWTLYERTTGAFKDGTVLARYAFTATGPQPKMNVHVKVFFDIAFGEGSPLEGCGLKETLIAIGRHLDDIVFTFKDRFDRQDFSSPP